MSVEYLENCLQLGMIVDTLNYFIDETFQSIDPTKIMYNEWYSQPDFILSKFPKSVIETEFLVPVLQDLVESKKGQTPLEELNKLEKRYLVNSNK
jgi:hypothetical protein